MFADVAMKCRIRPLRDLCYQAVLDRIVMKVIHMALKIEIIPNLMFPESPLPKIDLAPFDS
jgi:hypothetical protein